MRRILPERYIKVKEAIQQKLLLASNVAVQQTYGAHVKHYHTVV